MGRVNKFFKSNQKIFFLILIYFFVFMVASTLMIIGLTRSEKNVKVPYVIGKRFISVYNMISKSGLKPVVSFYEAFDIEDGLVLKQFPAAGNVVPEGRNLNLVISKNIIKVEVPVLVGAELTMAKNKLKNLHIEDKTVSLGIGVVSYIPSETSSNNIVMAQSPAAGEKISPKTKVNLLVSAGSITQDMEMPDLKGQSIELCYDLLMAKGLVVTEQFIDTYKKNSGKILSQNPARNKLLKKGDNVVLKIGYYNSLNRYYDGYEKVTYTIPDNQKKGLYEAYIEDNAIKRIRFSKNMGPGQKIEFVFLRTGNAKITILRDKKPVTYFTLNVDDFE